MVEEIELQNAIILLKKKHNEVVDFTVIDINGNDEEKYTNNGWSCADSIYEEGTNGPEAIFAHLVLSDSGQIDDDMTLNILAELGKIKQANWAKVMFDTIKKDRAEFTCPPISDCEE